MNTLCQIGAVCASRRASGWRASHARYRVTSLIRNTHLLGPYSTTKPRVLRWSWGWGLFLMSEVPLSLSTCQKAWGLSSIIEGNTAEAMRIPALAKGGGGARGRHMRVWRKVLGTKSRVGRPESSRRSGWDVCAARTPPPPPSPPPWALQGYLARKKLPPHGSFF